MERGREIAGSPALSRSTRVRLEGSGIALAAAFLVLGMLGLPASPLADAGSSGVSAAGSGIADLTNISVSNVSLEGPGSHFWAVSVEGGNPDPNTASFKGFLNASPFTVLRYGATWVDEENWSRGCLYSGTSTCEPVQNNVTDYAHLCLSSPRYYCILGVPAEINNVSTMAYEVEWLQRTTGWEPNCWAIGNEPAVWTHFGIPWKSWQSTDKRTPTAAQFARVAENYTDTLRSIDGPGTCIIGLESNEPISNIESFTNAVTTAVPNDTAVSFHSYPDNECTLDGVKGTTAPITQLLSPANLTLTLASYNDSVAYAHGLPVYLQEFNMGHSKTPTSCNPFVTGYTDAVFTSAVVAQALTYGVPEFTFFHFDCYTPGCLVNESTGVPTPTYWLYTDLLSQMDLEQISAVNFTEGGSPETFAVLGENGTHDRTLLLSNAQPYGWLNLSVASFLPSLPTDWQMQVISQNAETGVTTSPVWNLTTAPATLEIRNQSTVLVHFWSSLPFSSPVTFTETGLPAGTTWSVSLPGQDPIETTIPSSGSPDPTITLSDGSYSFSEASSNSSWAPPPAFPTFFVDGSSLTIPIAFSLVTYPVQFTQTGLPDGTDWTVTFNGTSLTGTTSPTPDPLLFPAVPNGTYSYSIADVPGFHETTLPYTGILTVVGAALAETIAFNSVNYTATISESGLPSGRTWSVTLNGTPMSLTTNGGADTLSWTGLENGTYAYAIADNSGWHQTDLAYSGSIVVDGGVQAIDGTGMGYTDSLAYTLVTYEATFSESTLPSGLTWQIILNGITQQLTTNGGLDTLTWSGLANGTYSYAISDISGWHQTTLPQSGELVVDGQNAAIDGTGIGAAWTLVYGEATYSVTFSESGLPSGLPWSVTFDGAPLSLTTDGGTDALTFNVPNGTYAYSIVGTPGSHESTIPYAGTETVAGADVVVGVTYVPVTYSVSFTESGLPSGLLWTLTVNGAAEGLTTDGGTDTLTFLEPNGTYAYSITGSPGWHQKALPYTGSVTVSNASVTEPTLAYAAVTYKATFTESGLPSGTEWSIGIDGQTLTSTTTKIVAVLGNGTFPFTVSDVPAYTSTPATGSITISGASVSRTLKFATSDYTITFAEGGLPSGTQWCVVLTPSDDSFCSTTTTIQVLQPDGSYDYSITAIPGYHIKTGSYAGVVTVNGANPARITVKWTAVEYTVKFAETGLPKDTSWSVTVDGKTKSGTAKSISFSLANATYAFTITASGYSAKSTPASPLTVAGGGVTVAVTFSASGSSSSPAGTAASEVGLSRRE